MQLLEHLSSALTDLVRQKMRTMLTMLGIIFGVGAVISMLSIGAGAQAEALEVIDSMGLRNIIVREKPVDQEDLYTTRERSLGLSLRDLEGVRRVADDIVTASAKKRIRTDQVLSSSGRTDGQVFGVFGVMHLGEEVGVDGVERVLIQLIELHPVDRLG